MSKSVSTTLDEKDYDALKALAKSEDRDISGQVRHMLRHALRISQGEARAHAINAELFPGEGEHHSGASGLGISPEEVAHLKTLPGCLTAS